MTDFPADILTRAQSIVAAISSRMEASSTLGDAATERDRCFVSVLFEFDIKSIPGNPFDIETPFGKPVTIGLGDVFAERDDLEEKANAMEVSR